MNKKNLLVAAAVSGILTAAVGVTGMSTAMADDAKGKCWGANTCKAKGECGALDGSHDCGGKNACKGKGWVSKTKKDCDALGKKDKNVKWEAMKG